MNQKLNISNLELKPDWKILAEYIYNHTNCCGCEEDDIDFYDEFNDKDDPLKCVTWESDLLIKIYLDRVEIMDTLGVNSHGDNFWIDEAKFKTTDFIINNPEISSAEIEKYHKTLVPKRRVEYTEIYYDNCDYIAEFLKILKAYKNTFYA